jgi:hypothetical protein
MGRRIQPCPRTKVKAGFAGLSSTGGDDAADGRRSRRRSVLSFGRRIPEKGGRSGRAFPADMEERWRARSCCPCFLNRRGQIGAPRQQTGRTNDGAERKPRAQGLGSKPSAAVLVTMLPRRFRGNRHIWGGTSLPLGWAPSGFEDSYRTQRRKLQILPAT